MILTYICGRSVSYLIYTFLITVDSGIIVDEAYYCDLLLV